MSCYKKKKERRDVLKESWRAVRKKKNSLFLLLTSDATMTPALSKMSFAVAKSASVAARRASQIATQRKKNIKW
jgi:hypothetical protein